MCQMLKTEEYAPLKHNRCIFLYILVWNIFSDLYVTCGHVCDTYNCDYLPRTTFIFHFEVKYIFPVLILRFYQP